MKRAFKTAVCAFLASAMLATPAYGESATVTGSSVNLRSGPGLNYRVVECLDWGTQVNVTDRSDSGWYGVEYNGETGFMSSDYLQITGEDFSDQFNIQNHESKTDEFSISSQTAKTEASNAYINAMYVRFRSGPGQGYSVLGEFNVGKGVTVFGNYGEWTQCSIDGREGYVYSAYVSPGEFSRSTEGRIEDEFAVYSGRSFIESEPTPTPVPTETTVQTQSPELSAVVTPEPTSTEKPAELVIVTPEPAEEQERHDDTETTEGIAAHITGDYVRFRMGPGTNYPIINSYNRGKSILATALEGEWVKCVIDCESGYVFAQYVAQDKTENQQNADGQELSSDDEDSNNIQNDEPETGASQLPEAVQTEARDGYISGNNVRMRAQPSMQSEILGELFFGNAVTITGVSGEWTACTYGEWSGYIYSSYVEEGTYTYNTTSSTGSAQGQEIAEYALQFVGYNYTWGGASPDTGFDCSGLVYYVYSQFGYTLNRVASDQAMNGVAVNDLEPGDVLCFYTSGSYIGHAGIYIGDGKFVHAANSATGVVVSDLNGYYSSRGYEARRIVNG